VYKDGGRTRGECSTSDGSSSLLLEVLFCLENTAPDGLALLLSVSNLLDIVRIVF